MLATQPSPFLLPKVQNLNVADGTKKCIIARKKTPIITMISHEKTSTLRSTPRARLCRWVLIPPPLHERIKQRLDELGFVPYYEQDRPDVIADNSPNCTVTMIFSGNHDVLSRLAFGEENVDFTLKKKKNAMHISPDRKESRTGQRTLTTSFADAMEQKTSSVLMFILMKRLPMRMFR